MVVLGEHPLTLEDLGRLTWMSQDSLSLNANRRAILANEHQKFLRQMQDLPLYGVHTGFGQSQVRAMEAHDSPMRQSQLIAYHGCGLGPILREESCRAIFAVRCNNLVQGGSGVSLGLIDALMNFWNAGLTPAIPSWGSVGASGDLTPLSYLAASLGGDRQVYAKGQIQCAKKAILEAGLTPYAFQGREALAIMNGTAAMTGLAALAWLRLSRLAKIACEFGALMVELVPARTAAFHPDLHKRKPHPGQVKAADLIYQNLYDPNARLHGRCPQRGVLQDVYSIRCMPQILGPIFDALDFSRSWITTEMNSTSDNPVLGPDGESFFHGGHFYGGHIALACDSLKVAAANLANLWDRQCAFLMGPGHLPGITPELRLEPDQKSTGHGLKAVQITLSALCCEVVKNAFPASVTTRPTESNNQDIVSLGTHAALDLSRAMDLLQPMAAILGLALNQIREILSRSGRLANLTASLGEFALGIRRVVGLVDDDRPLDKTITELGQWLMRPEEILRVDTHS